MPASGVPSAANAATAAGQCAAPQASRRSCIGPRRWLRPHATLVRRTARGTQDIDDRKLLQKGEGAYFAVAPATRARLARVRNMVLGAFVFSLNVMPHGPVIGLQSGPAVGPS